MINKSVLVKPKEGLKVFNPSTKLHIKESGELVVMSTYWKRRLNDKEIEIIEPIQEKKEVKENKKSKKSKKSMEVEK